MTATDVLAQTFDQAGFSLPEELRQKLHQFLQETDDHALESIKAKIGGPFGSRFVIVTEAGAIHTVGNVVGNAVVSSGIASKHAEHQDWDLNLQALVEKLEELKGQRKMLLQLSSGESCINCHAKQEAGITWLKQQGYLEEGDLAHVIFGASYRQTADVAGFNDLVYLLALQDIMGLEPNAGPHNNFTDKDLRISEELAGRFAHTYEGIADIPQDVAKVFESADQPVVVIVKDGQVFAQGVDGRDQHFSLTPEVSALQNACRRQREEFDMFESWDLGGATVYTSTKEIGALMLAEGFWSNALQFVSVQHPRADEWQTVETKGRSNAETLQLIALRPYGAHAQAALSVSNMQIENKAQIWWRDDPESPNYDGAKAEI